MKNTSILCLMIFLLLVACKKPESTWTEEDAIKVHAEVESTLREYHSDIERDGLLAELKYLDSTEQFSWFAPGFSGAIGYDSVVAILKVMAPMFPGIDHTWDSLVVTPVSYQEASYMGLVTSVMTDTAGTNDTVRFREEGKMIRRSDGWKLLSGKTIEIN